MTFFDAHGRAIELADAGRRGGEGSVHRIVGDPSRVAKIYHGSRLGSEVHAKLRVMVEQPPADPSRNGSRHRSIAWVDGLVFGDRAGRELRGFTMPFVDTDEFRQAHVYYDPSDRIRLFGGGFTWRHLLVASHNLASAVAAVHAAGHRVGDLRETNLLVAPSAFVTLIDCDSFQIRDRRTLAVYPTRVATGDYLPPELQGIDFGRENPDRSHGDLFALAVLVFRFLMLGVHPFQARGPAVLDAPTTEAKIRKGLFAFGNRRRGVAPPGYAPPYTSVPGRVRDLFSRAFIAGHANPEQRPAASEWVSVLATELERSRSCVSNPNHVYAQGLRACPWCRVGSDPFPPPTFVGRQILVQNPPDQVSESARVDQVRAYARVALADGAFTDTEIAYLRKSGAELGLRTAVVDRVIDAEARRTPPVANGSSNGGPATNGSVRASGFRLRHPLHAVSERRTRSAMKAAAPVVLASAAAGALLPVLVPVALALIGLPAVAAIGEVRSTRGWRARAKLPLRFAAHAHRALGHASLLYVPLALLGLVASFVRVAPDAVLIRLMGAASAAALATFAIGWLPYGKDGFGAPMLVGRDILWRGLVGESGRARRPTYIIWAVALGAAVAASMGHAFAWPVAP